MAAYYIAQAYGQYDSDNNKIVWKCSNNTANASGGIFANLENNKTIGDTDTDKNFNIWYLGIQSLPGVRFNINHNTTEAEAEVMIGQTGIFELNLMDTYPINSVQFQNLSDMLEPSDASRNVNYCLIDVIYTEE